MVVWTYERASKLHVARKAGELVGEVRKTKGTRTIPHKYYGYQMVPDVGMLPAGVFGSLRAAKRWVAHGK